MSRIHQISYSHNIFVVSEPNSMELFMINNNLSMNNLNHRNGFSIFFQDSAHGHTKCRENFNSKI